MRIHLKYKRSLSVLEGYLDLPFENEKGWHWPEGDSTSIKPTKLIEADYNKAIGNSTFYSGWGYCTLYVDYIDIEEGYAEIRFNNDGFWYNDGAVMKCPFNVYEGEIDVSAEDIEIVFGVKVFDFTYNVSENRWNT